MFFKKLKNKNEHAYIWSNDFYEKGTVLTTGARKLGAHM